MGEVVRFQRPERRAYEAEVRHICALAKVEDLVPEFLAGCTPLETVADHCIWIVFRQKPPWMAARHLARLKGRAGNRRRALPKSLSLYRRVGP